MKVFADTLINVTFWPQLFDLTLMFGAGNEPATVAEFEAMYPLPYYPYSAPTLKSVNITGIRSTGFNLWDEEWEKGYIIDATGQNEGGVMNQYLRSKNYIDVFPSTTYYFMTVTNISGKVYFYDASEGYIGYVSKFASDRLVEIPSNCHKMRFWLNYVGDYQNDICINLSDPSRNGTYEPHWSQERSIPVSTYFPTGLKSAGSVYDELTETQAVTRVGSVDLGTLTWVTDTDATGQYFYGTLAGAQRATSASAAGNIRCAKYDTAPSNNVQDKNIAISSNNTTLYVRDTTYSDAAAFKTAMSGVMLYYELATPVTTPIDPPLNITYKTELGGTEEVMLDSTATAPQSAPVPMVTVYGYTADGAIDKSLSVIAPVERGKASANYAVGSYLVMGHTLYKVTTAIASGESITPGTNVVATTVMAEVIALTS